MEIHRPKPFHGVRELIKEMAVIVGGVLIALSAEQTVEMFHWRHEVETERRALLAEVRDNLTAVKTRIDLEPCVARRLAELQVIFDRHARGEPLGAKGPVGLPIPGGSSRGSWNIALSGQGIAHMPHEEQLVFSNAFSNFENWDTVRQEERVAWLRLGVLDDPRGFTDTDWALLRQAYAEARATHLRVKSVGPFILRTAAVGQEPQATTPQEQFKGHGYGAEICQTMLGS